MSSLISLTVTGYDDVIGGGASRDRVPDKVEGEGLHPQHLAHWYVRRERERGREREREREGEGERERGREGERERGRGERERERGGRERERECVCVSHHEEELKGMDIHGGRSLRTICVGRQRRGSGRRQLPTRRT